MPRHTRAVYVAASDLIAAILEEQHRWSEFDLRRDTNPIRYQIIGDAAFIIDQQLRAYGAAQTAVEAPAQTANVVDLMGWLSKRADPQLSG